MEKVRIDKWLWAVRIFKSRTLAADAVKSGRVKIGELTVKPSHMVMRQDVVQVKKDGFNLVFKVLDLLDKRAGAPIAQACYVNQTPEEEMNKYKDWYIGKNLAERRDKGTGRPTKKERREIDTFKSGDDADGFWWEETDG